MSNLSCSCFGKVKFPRGVIGEDGKQFVKGVSSFGAPSGPETIVVASISLLMCLVFLFFFCHPLFAAPEPKPEASSRCTARRRRVEGASVLQVDRLGLARSASRAAAVQALRRLGRVGRQL